jgi:hypothetical protein
MRYLTTVLAVLVFTGNLFSQDAQKKGKKPAVENTVVENKISSDAEKPVFQPEASSVKEKKSYMIYGGTHKYLYGYEDVRYVDKDDQGDYLKADGRFFGMEFSYLGFGKEIFERGDIKVGGLMNFYYRSLLPSKELYAVPGVTPAIPAEVILPDANDRTQISSVKLGVFGGIDENWYELNLGFHAEVMMEKERERLYRAPDSTDANPKYVPRKGRGWTWSDQKMRLNFLGRIGLADNAHFILSAFREDYDPNYGIITAKISVPLNDYFKMQIGSYLYPASAFFFQPVISYGGFSLSPKIGLIINYRDDNFEKVGILEGAFMSVAASFVW